MFEEKAKGKGKASTGKAQNRLTPTQLRELEEQKEAEVLRGYRRVTELWARVLTEGEGQEEAEREWMFEAEKLVNTFRETRNLFLTTRVLLKPTWIDSGINFAFRIIPSAVCSLGLKQQNSTMRRMKIAWHFDFTLILVGSCFC